MKGEELRKFRKEMGWTIIEMAEQTGVTFGTISKYENEKNPIPRSFQKLIELMKRELAAQ